MNNDSNIKIYISPSKPYYYPGENLAATILLDVLETTECDKMQIIAKGKEIVRAYQKTYIDTFQESESEENNTDDERPYKSKSSYRNYDSSSEEIEQDDTSIARELDESHKIFKYKKIIEISKDSNIFKGKYSFPFEVELPENIPGSFLFMEKNAYIEIIYTIKVKLNKIKIKESIPIVIRQKKEIFKYPKDNEYSKKIMGCCFDTNESTIKLSKLDNYSININEIRLNAVLDNTRCDIEGSPLTLDFYQKIIIFPKNKSKKLKITKRVGEYKGKKILHPRRSLNHNISFLMDRADYAAGHLKKTKSIKYFKHKDVIPFLNQSIKSEFVNCEYEVYAEVQFPNWSVEELGVFLPILVYAPEKGILSKTIEQKSKEFENSILNKKIFLNSKSKDDSPEFETKYKGKNYYKKNKNYDSSSSNEEYQNIKKVGKRYSLLKVKSFGFKEKDNNEDKNESKDDDNDINENNIDNNIENNLKINDQYKIKDNYNEEEKKNVMNEDGSFGYAKGKTSQQYVDTNSNHIKKEFGRAYLDDALDDEFLEKESSH